MAVTEAGDYRAVCCEGEDQVGKADAVLNLRSELIERDINVTYASFPIYATPVGTCIRKMLKEKCPDTVITPENLVDTRMSMYALNRLEFMNSLLSNEEYKNSLLLFDRGPFSNAITIAYGMSCREGENGNIDRYIGRSFDIDSLMIDRLSLDKCLLQMVSEEDEWHTGRSKGDDLYELSEVQMNSRRIYKKYAEVVAGWRTVVTKSNNGWRDRGMIKDEIIGYIELVFGDLSNVDNIKGGLLRNIGPKEIAGAMYRGAKYSFESVEEYERAVDENNKDEMYRMACTIGEGIAQSCDEVVVGRDEVRREMRRLVESQPEVLKVLRYFLGEDFASKFAKGIGYDKERVG